MRWNFARIGRKSYEGGSDAVKKRALTDLRGTLASSYGAEEGTPVNSDSSDSAS